MNSRRINWVAVFLLVTTGLMSQRFERVDGFESDSELLNSTGIAVADFDLDGYPDIYVVASEIFDPDDPFTWSRLLKNEGDNSFKDVTLSSNLIHWQAETRDGNLGSKMGASWGDYNNDGYPDLFISNYGLDELWLNEGDGTFRNVTEIANVQGCFYCYSTGAIWWDYDQDGDLDLYVCDWLKENRLYRNDGNHKFVERSVTSGLNDRGHTFSSLPFDLDEDGLLDLYVVNDIGENRFYFNQGNGMFEEATDQVGLSNRGNGMGIDICDHNNDGLFDIYVTNIHQYVPNPFFVNQGDGVFKDESAALGIEDTGWGWGARFFDADHDADEDLYVVNGFDANIAKNDINKFFINDNNSFFEISSDAGVNNVDWGMGLEVVDLDLDGDLEMIVANRAAHSALYRNMTSEIAESSNWIQVDLEGTISNRNGFGAVVKISCDDSSHYYRYHSGVNVFGQSIKPVHFGLKSHEEVREIQVYWPSGSLETFGQFLPNQVVKLVEGTGTNLDADKTVPVKEKDRSAFAVYPNPFESGLNLKSENGNIGKVLFEMVDLEGRNIFTAEVDISETGSTPLIDAEPRIQSGLYFYSITGRKLRHSGKIVKR